MGKDPARSRAVREPVQVYLAEDDSALLDRLAAESGLTKAEILRRGVRSFAREHGGGSQKQEFLDRLGDGHWPESGTARDHDAALADAHLGKKARRR